MAARSFWCGALSCRCRQIDLRKVQAATKLDIGSAYRQQLVLPAGQPLSEDERRWLEDRLSVIS
jgi:hypothetical protein